MSRGAGGCCWSRHSNNKEGPMLLGILITIFLTLGLGAAFRRQGEGGLIARRPYNNRYSDASAAAPRRPRGAREPAGCDAAGGPGASVRAVRSVRIAVALFAALAVAAP